MEQVPCERFSETEAIQFSETEDTGFWRIVVCELDFMTCPFNLSAVIEMNLFEKEE
jgi:hypothetical protein